MIRLGRLRCIEVPFLSQRGKDSLLDWVLRHAASLEALNLGEESFASAGDAMRFKHLKHLIVTRRALQGADFQPGIQLPALETLHVGDPAGPCRGDVCDNIDVSGCLRLRLLVIVGCVYQLTKHPTCQLGIALTFDRQHNPYGFQSLRADGMRDQLGLITQLKLATVDCQPSGAAKLAELMAFFAPCQIWKC